MPQVAPLEEKHNTPYFLEKELFRERKFAKAFPATEKALQLQKEKGEAPDGDLLYGYGIMLYFGYGCKRNKKEGMKYMLMAWENGCSYADRVLKWMKFDSREFFFGHITGIVLALLLAPLAFTFGELTFSGTLLRAIAIFIASWYLVFNLFSLVWAGINKYFRYMGERLGMFIFSLIGIVLGGMIVCSLFLLVISFFCRITPANRDFYSWILTFLFLGGGIVGFKVGKSAGGCIGSSTAETFISRD